MTMTASHPGIKICGLTDPESIRVSSAAGAGFLGFVFYPPSPRSVPVDAAQSLRSVVPGGVVPVGLFVDPDDELLGAVLPRLKPGLIQLHGSETPQRVGAIKARYGLPVMKALKIAGPEDLETLSLYEEVSDWILFDAKAPTGSTLPGGNGVVFDWSVLKSITPRRPWMLSGGLTTENVGEALKVLSPDAVDVSSGVEDAPGRKNADKIRAFIQAVKGA